MLNWPRIQFSGMTGPASVHSPTSFLSARISACRCAEGVSRKKLTAASCFASASSQRFHNFRMWARIPVCRVVGGGLRKRELPPTTLQTGMRAHILKLWKRWDDAEAKQLAAVNFFLDTPSAQRQAEIRALKNEVGECTDAGPVMPENWMRGQFNITCAKGTVGVFFTLAPTQPPAVQHLSFQKLASPAVRMSAPTGAPPGVSSTHQPSPVLPAPPKAPHA